MQMLPAFCLEENYHIPQGNFKPVMSQKGRGLVTLCYHLVSFSSAELMFFNIWKWPDSVDKKASIHPAQRHEELKVLRERIVFLKWMFQGRNLNHTCESHLSH